MLAQNFNKFLIAVFAFVQFFFLISISLEKPSMTYLTAFISVVIALFLLAYGQIFCGLAKKFPPRIHQPIIVMLVTVGAIITYALSVKVGMGPVIASACVGLVASFLPFKKFSKQLNQEIPAAIYCGSFVGMSSSFVLSSVFLVGVAGLLAGLVYVVVKNDFAGYGGELGSIAFMGVVATALLVAFT